MRRSSEQRPLSLRAWIVAVVLVLGGMLAALHFADPHRMAGTWPFGVRPAEVDLYAGIADLPFVGSDSVRVPVMYLGSTQRSGRCWPDDRGRGRDTRWLETTGFGDSVEVRPLRSEPNALVVRLRNKAELRGQRAFILRPATDALLRARLVHLLAVELEVLAPELTLVRLVSCGKDLGIHVKEEVVNDLFLQRQGLGGAASIDLLFDPRAGHALVPRVKGDSLVNAQLLALWSRSAGDGEAVPVDAWARWALLRSLAVPNDPWAGEHPAAYRFAEQQLIPLWRAPRTSTLPALHTFRAGPVTAVIGTEAFAAAFRKAQDKLLAKRGELRERLQQVAAAWMPHLHADGSRRIHLARADATIDELLRALTERDRVTTLQLPLEEAQGHGLLATTGAIPVMANEQVSEQDPLAELKRMTKLVAQGDSVVFPRGKYRINGELRFPQGHRVILLPGARIELGNDAQLQVRGPLEVRGTKLNPVFIRAAAKGVQHKGLEVVGGAGDAARISGLQMSGGGADRTLIRIQGMAQVAVQGCVLEGAPGGALLHVLGGEVDLRGGVLLGGTVQLTQTKALVKDVLMRGAPRGRGAGGVVVEGGRVRIEGGATMGQEGAGVRCANAAQVVLLGTVVEGCATGVEVRDGATVHVDDVRFRKNDLVMSVKTTGAVRGASRVVLYRNSFQDNARDREVDAGSSVTDGGVLSDAVRSGERFTP